MPPTRTGVGSAPRVPLLVRAVILGLHWHGGITFNTISTKLGVAERTASNIIRKAKVTSEINLSLGARHNYAQVLTGGKTRAMDSEDFEDVLACLESEYGGGMPPKIAEGSEASIALHDLSQKDETYWQMPFEDIAKELGISAARSTLEHVFHDHHDIFRRKATHKPFLSAGHMEARLAFAHMALHVAMHHIVFTDEMWVEFNSIRRAFNVSRKRGVDPNEWAIHDKEATTIRVMFWGATCMGHRGPYHIWEQETEEDQDRHRAIIQTENTIRQKQQQVNQTQASVPGTWQHKVLEGINADIIRQNAIEGRVGNRKRRQRGPHQEFKEEQFIYRSKGGINWVPYRENVLEPLLYPWIDQLQTATGMPITYLVKDNALSHQTVQRVDKGLRTKKGIITFNWPSKSPDLNQIEPIWSDEKDEIATYQFTGASQETVRDAKATLIKVWEELPQVQIDRRCATFHEKLQRCILHGGNNNYDG